MIVALLLLFVLCPIVFVCGMAFQRFVCGMAFQRMVDRERRGGYIGERQ